MAVNDIPIGSRNLFVVIVERELEKLRNNNTEFSNKVTSEATLNAIERTYESLQFKNRNKQISNKDFEKGTNTYCLSHAIAEKNFLNASTSLNQKDLYTNRLSLIKALLQSTNEELDNVYTAIVNNVLEEALNSIDGRVNIIKLERQSNNFFKNADKETQEVFKSRPDFKELGDIEDKKIEEELFNLQDILKDYKSIISSFNEDNSLLLDSIKDIDLDMLITSNGYSLLEKIISISKEKEVGIAK